MTAPNVAVVGLGVGEQHARGYLRHGCTLSWLYDLDPKRSQALATQLGAGRVATSFEEILADPTVDVVSLATYDDHHAAGVVSALRAGKHVFCEKPLCRTEQELSDIEVAWRESGKHLASNLVLRAAPLYRRVRDLIQSGDLGEIYAFYGDYLYGRLPKITEGWRADVPDYSVMQGGGVHLVDLLLWMTGEVPTAVRSQGNRIASAGTRFQHLDFVSSTFSCASGALGVISANFGCVLRHQHVVRIFGTRGTFLSDDMGARIYRQRDPGGPPDVVADSPLPASKADLLPTFLAEMGSPERGRAQTERDFRVIRACLAADDALTKPVVSIQ